jgi:RNA polymerase sigma-70 factor (ECF subfamily)
MPPNTLDPDSARWLRELEALGSARDAASTELHALLLRVARSEAVRRHASLPDRGFEEIDDLCVQAAGDALMAILAKLNDFRGASRFTTWACKFVIFEISTRLRRHAWRHRKVESDETVWDRLPDGAPGPLQLLQHDELRHSLRRAVREQLTDRQRSVFQAAVLEDVPIDVLAQRLGSSRGAIYKTLHDARRKLHGSLVAAGYAERVS